MRIDRWYYSAVAGFFVVLMLVGFHSFVSSGRAAGGRVIDPAMVRLDTIHGAAIGAWFLLFLVQSLLVGTRNRRVHFTLGWSAIVIGLAIFISGSLVAIRSVQVMPQFQFFGMEYRRFLLMMLVEIWLFTAFVTVGIVQRRKPKIHRPAMLLAGLALLAGATARMPFLHPVFGEVGWVGLFGPTFCIGAVLLLVRALLTRSIDRWFAMGYAAWVLIFIGAAKLAMTDAWTALATAILKL